jgi:hypothetical protein
MACLSRELALMRRHVLQSSRRCCIACCTARSPRVQHYLLSNAAQRVRYILAAGDDQSFLMLNARGISWQREMIKVHALWRKEKKRVQALEQDLLHLRDLHAKEIDEWRVWLATH